MSMDLFEIDDAAKFAWRGLLVVGAVTVAVFTVVTLVFWVHGMVAQPVFSPTSTAIVGQPRSSSEWLVVALLLGAIAASGAIVLGLLVLGLVVTLAVALKGLEARRVSSLSVEKLSLRARLAAEDSIRRRGNAP